MKAQDGYARHQTADPVTPLHHARPAPVLPAPYPTRAATALRAVCGRCRDGAAGGGERGLDHAVSIGGSRPRPYPHDALPAVGLRVTRVCRYECLPHCAGIRCARGHAREQHRHCGHHLGDLSLRLDVEPQPVAAAVAALHGASLCLLPDAQQRGARQKRARRDPRGRQRHARACAQRRGQSRCGAVHCRICGRLRSVGRTHRSVCAGERLCRYVHGHPPPHPPLWRGARAGQQRALSACSGSLWQHQREQAAQPPGRRAPASIHDTLGAICTLPGPLQRIAAHASLRA